jgi:hypothetical protein
MANDKVQYIVEVLKQGDGATQAIADFEKVEAASTATNATIATGAVASSTAVKAGTRDIKNALSIIALTAFPQAAQAGILFKSTMDLTRGSAAALGMGLTTAATGLAAIGVAAVTAYQGIKLLNAETVKSTTAAALAGGNERLFQTIKQQIASGLAKNELSAAGAANLERELMATIKLRGETDKEFLALKAVGDKLLNLKEAHEAVADIAVSANQETLSGLARQIQVIQDIHQARLKDIELVEKQSGANLQAEYEKVEEATVAQSNAALDNVRQQLEIKSASTELDARQAQLDIEAANAQRDLNQLKANGLLLDNEAVDLQNKLNAAVKNQQEQLQLARLQQTAFFRVAVEGVQSFASGFSGAIVNALSGGKDAMREFFSQFFKQMAAAILQAIILKAIFSAISGIGGGSSSSIQLATSLTGVASGRAQGGISFAANGIQTVSQPTFLPKFNVIAGEAGAEMLTVLARPRMMDLGGVQAAVGNAGVNRLAIADANQLQERFGGGKTVVEVRLSPGLTASIVEQSRDAAVVTVTQQLDQDSTLSRKVKGLSA